MAKAKKTRSTLLRRLEELEDHFAPAGEPKVLQIVFVSPDGSREERKNPGASYRCRGPEDALGAKDALAQR